MNYGFPYKGSKNKIAQQIINCIPSAENFYDLFCGGGAITHCALLQNRWKNYIMNDIDKGLSQLFVDAVNGKYKNEKRWISREEFFKLKDTDAYVRYIWSFGNNGRDYMFSREIEETKRLGHNAIVFGDIKPLEKLLNIDLSFLLKINDLSERRKTFCRAMKKLNESEYLQRNQILERLECLVRLQELQQLQQLQRLQQLQQLQQDYRTVNILPNSVIYCDIPYKGTNVYGKSGKPSFDYDSFYDWCERQTEPVFISEYTMPDNRFKCIIEIEKTSTFSATNNNKKTVEKLFIPRCQEDVSIKQLSLF